MRNGFFFNIPWGQPDFSWPVCDAGHELVESFFESHWGDSKGPDLFVVPKNGVEAEWPEVDWAEAGWARRKPFETPGLFITFADTAEADTAKILEFTNLHGLLRLQPDEEDLCALIFPPARYAVNLSAMQSEARRLHEAVMLWTMLRERPSNLATALRWTQDEELEFQESFLLWEALQGDPQTWFREQAECLPLELQTRHLLAELVNSLAGPQMANLTVGEDGLFSARPADPPDLLAALWLQFGHAMLADQRFQHCSECGDVFELTGRSDKKTCSTRCRLRQSRRIRAGGVTRKPGRPRRQKETE